MPWIVFGAIVLAVVAYDPTRRSVVKVYHESVERFFAGRNLYWAGIHGFLYLPAFSLFFAPFHALPMPAGDLLWRATGFVLLACGVRRLCAYLAPGRRDAAFHLSGYLIMLGAMSPLRNGQANLWIAALMLHAALDIRERRLTRGSALLVLGVLVKPIALVPVLLFGALERRTLPRVALGLVLVWAAPFLCADPGYVWRMYAGCVDKLLRSSMPAVIYTELFGGLQQLGLDVPQAARQSARALMALVTLGLCWRAYRRAGAAYGAVTVLFLSAAYLIAFNPRSEPNSIVILAAVLAPAAAAAWLAGRRREGVALGAACFLLGTHVIRWPVQTVTRGWLKPLLALAFGAWTVCRLRVPASRAGGPGARRSAARPAAAD